MHQVPAITGMSGFDNAVIGRLSERRIRNGDSSNRLEHQSFHLSAFLSGGCAVSDGEPARYPSQQSRVGLTPGNPHAFPWIRILAAADGLLPSLALRMSAVAPV